MARPAQAPVAASGGELRPDPTPPGDPAGGAPGIDGSRLPELAELAELAELVRLAELAVGAAGAVLAALVTGVDSPAETDGASGVPAGRPAVTANGDEAAFGGGIA